MAPRKYTNKSSNPVSLLLLFTVKFVLVSSTLASRIRQTSSYQTQRNFVDLLPKLEHQDNLGSNPSAKAIAVLTSNSNSRHEPSLPLDQFDLAMRSHNINDDQQVLTRGSGDRTGSSDSASDTMNETDYMSEAGDLGDSSQQPEPAANNQHDIPDNSMYIDQHKSRVRAMQDLFERRFLSGPHHMSASQELSPISIGIDPVSGMASPFQVSPFSVPNQHDHSQQVSPIPKPQLAQADHMDQGIGPSLPFALGQLPQLLGFQEQAFDGPQRGDQSAHSNFHSAMPPIDSDQSNGHKTWPKIFRFTDGRINLSDFEKQKKIRLSAKNHESDNHIESAPIMFDGRQLKRKSFLILHGGIFSK